MPGVATRWKYEQVRDEELFDACWLSQVPRFRAQWERALEEQRIRYRERMEAIA